MTAAYALIVFWLPGAVIFPMPVSRNRDKRAALEADERLFWQVMLSVGVSTGVVLALAAAGTVDWNNAKLRVALALDVTGFNVVERKMTALKTAARRRSTHPAARHLQQHQRRRHHALTPWRSIASGDPTSTPAEELGRGPISI